MRIALYISSLGPGGAERVATTLCNAWSAEHHVDLVTLQNEHASVHYQLADGVVLARLNLLGTSPSPWSAVANNVIRIRALRRYIRASQPDVLVCFMTESNVIGVLAGMGLGVPVVISERVHPGFHRLPALHAAARWLTYRWADVLTVQTEDIARWYDQHLGLATVRIPNPIDLASIPGSLREVHENGGYRLLSIGRLEWQKGFDVLIEAFARVADAHPRWFLEILGEGGQRGTLESLIEARGLHARVTLPGVASNVPMRLRDTAVYVHPARYEGYPNAVMEALAAGCCVVAADSPGGVRELLQNGRYGLLARVDDVDDLANCLDRAMSDDALRDDFVARAREAVLALDAPLISDRWVALFRSVLASRRRHRYSGGAEG